MGRELQKIWNVNVKIIPLVVGSLGAIPKQFGNRLKQTDITAGAAQVPNTVLLATARILIKFLESKATGCGSISTVFSNIVLLCVSSRIIKTIIIITTTIIIVIIIIKIIIIATPTRTRTTTIIILIIRVTTQTF